MKQLVVKLKKEDDSDKSIHGPLKSNTKIPVDKSPALAHLFSPPLEENDIGSSLQKMLRAANRPIGPPQDPLPAIKVMSNNSIIMNETGLRNRRADYCFRMMNETSVRLFVPQFEADSVKRKLAIAKIRQLILGNWSGVQGREQKIYVVSLAVSMILFMYPIENPKIFYEEAFNSNSYKVEWMTSDEVLALQVPEVKMFDNRFPRPDISGLSDDQFSAVVVGVLLCLLGKKMTADDGHYLDQCVKSFDKSLTHTNHDGLDGLFDVNFGIIFSQYFAMMCNVKALLVLTLVKQTTNKETIVGVVRDTVLECLKGRDMTMLFLVFNFIYSANPWILKIRYLVSDVNKVNEFLESVPLDERNMLYYYKLLYYWHPITHLTMRTIPGLISLAILMARASSSRWAGYAPQLVLDSTAIAIFKATSNFMVLDNPSTYEFPNILCCDDD